MSNHTSSESTIRKGSPMIALAGVACLTGSVDAQLVTTSTITDGFYIASPIAILLDPAVDGEIVETRITINFLLDDFADPIEDWQIQFIMPRAEPGDGFTSVVQTYDLNDFSFAEGTLFGTVTTTAFNGEIFNPPDFVGGWEIFTSSKSGSSFFWGTGNLRWEVDTVAVPAPGAAALLGMGLIAAGRRRR